MSYRIRDCTTDDLPSVRRLLPRLADFDVPENRDPVHLWSSDLKMYEQHLAGERPECFARVAEAFDGEVLGTSLVSLRPELLSHRPSAHLEALVIARSAEGTGMGRALLEDAQTGALARGAETMTLHVFARNVRARRLYEASGFDGELLRYIRPLQKLEVVNE